MAKLFANTEAVYRARLDRDVYGQDTYAADKRIMIAVIELRRKEVQSDLRADSSASIGRLRETYIEGKLLLTPDIVPNEHDVIVTMGNTVKITSVFERRDLMGNLSHWEVGVSQGQL